MNAEPRQVSQRDEAGDLRTEPCDCADCRTHGQVIRLIAGMEHWIAIQEDGTARAWYGWSSTNRRKLVRLRPTRDHFLVPVDRGTRRREVVAELGPLLNEIGPMPSQIAGGLFQGLALSDRRGPEPGGGVSTEFVKTAVEELRSKGLTVEKATERVATDMGFAAETIRRHFYAGRGGGRG